MVTGDLRTLPVGLALRAGAASDVPSDSGYSDDCQPAVLLYIFFQRHFIRGMVSGALKNNLTQRR